MTRTPEMNRRTVLKGLGAAVALPWLESVAAAAGPVAAQATAGPARRVAFMYVPNGVIMPDWKPKQDGPLGVLPDILKALEPHKSHLNVLSELTLDKARANGDGPGDHARAMSAFLTGTQPRKTHGADIKVGISADQYVARAVGDQTRFPSLELGIDKGQNAGNCDSGYSCAYQFNLSWTGPTSPLAPEPNPRLAFERLFGGGPIGERRKNYKLRQEQQRSVLDFVRDDARRLQAELSGRDRQKLDEYLNGVRELEQRIERAERMGETPDPNVATPPGIPSNYQEHIRLMFTVLQLAFQTDSTRVATFLMAHDGSNRSFADIGVPEGHHDLSHHGNDKKKKEKIRDINTFHAKQLAYLLTKLKSIKEGDGTLLDHSMIAYGSGNSDGNAHNHDNLPILLAGRAGGTIQTGRHIKYQNETPLNNLWLSMLERMDIRLPFLGDSTGALKGLNG